MPMPRGAATLTAPDRDAPPVAVSTPETLNVLVRLTAPEEEMPPFRVVRPVTVNAPFTVTVLAFRAIGRVATPNETDAAWSDM